MKKRFILVFALFLIAAMVMGGAFSYFSATLDNPGRITSGTLKLAISNQNANYGTVADVWNVTDMAPGQTVSGDLWMNNIGTVGARQVSFEWKGITNDPITKNLADKIYLVHVWDSKNTADAVVGVAGVADTNGDGKTSLTELAALSGRFSWPFDAVSDVDNFLVPGAPQYLHMEWQFDPLAENILQDVKMDYTLTITAHQTVVFPIPPALVP